MDKIEKMEDLKNAIIEKVNQSEATNPLKLYSELLVLLYCVGYRDGQDYVHMKRRINVGRDDCVFIGEDGWCELLFHEPDELKRMCPICTEYEPREHNGDKER